MDRWLLSNRLSHLTVSALICALLAGSAATRRAAEARVVDPSLLIAFRIDCVDCSVCIDEGEPGHKAPEGDDDSIYDPNEGSHSSCYTTGSCSENHPIAWPNCAPTEEEDAEEFVATLESVRKAVIDGRLDEAKRLAEANHERNFAFVPHRNAVQVTGRSGEVVAHISLD